MKNANNAHLCVGMVGRGGVKEYTALGCFSNNIGVKESAARTLEYAFTDYCIYK